MATVEQVQQGLLKYIDSDIMPKLGGLKKIGLGAYVALASRNARGVLEKYMHHPGVEVLGVISEGGEIDVDALYQAIAPMMANGEKVPISIPMIGEIRLDRSDLDKIYQNVKG